MLTENSILLTAVRNPFDPYKSRVTLNLEYKAQPIYMYLKDVLPETLEEFEVISSVNGKIVDNDFIPLPNSSIVFTQVPAGGGGRGNDALRIVASIAVIIISIYAPYAAGLVTAEGALSAEGAMLSAGIAIGGSLLINALLPITTPDEIEASSSYGWGANNVISEGAAFPVVYGTMKMVPPLIGLYSQNIWVGGSGTPDLQRLSMLFAIADHSVSSIGTIQINGSPYTAYDDVSVVKKTGGLSQTVIPNFQDTRTQQGYNICINKTNQWYGPYDVPGSDTTCIGIGIGFPNGIGYFNNDGNVERLYLKLQVQYRIKDTGGGVPGSWVNWLKANISAGEATALRYHTQTDIDSYDKWSSTWTKYPDYIDWHWEPTPSLYRAGADLSPDEYQVRFLSPTTFSPENRQVIQDMYIDYIEGIVKDDFIYPGTSLLCVNAIATDQLSGGLPTITCVVARGNITVYEQDGTPHTVASSNPAWVCYDILNNDEYGCNVSYTRINYSEFLAWATFCDTNSYECNIIYDTNMQVPDALAQASLLGRGHVVQRGTNFGVVIDKADSPVQMFTMGNIIEDTLSISYISKKDRVNTIATTYYDSTEDYDARIFELRTTDFDADTDMEENKITLDLRGCTDKTQALELSRFLLNCNETLVQTAEFEVQVDALASNVGDVIIVSHDVPDWGSSGDVVSATSNTIVIDHAIETEDSANYKCIVRHKADDTMEEVAINNPGGVKTASFTLTGTWSTVPSEHDLYIIGIENQSYRDFRIVRISRTQEMRRKVTALEYNVGVYSDSDSISDYEEQPHLPEVYENSVSVYELYRKEGGIMKTIVVITWRGYGGLFYVNVKEESSTKWRLVGTYSYSMSAEYKDAEPGKTYIFAVSTTANPGDGETVTITVSGYTYNPPRVIWPVTGLEIFGQGNNTIWQNRDLKIRWNMISSTFPTTAGSETTGAGAFPPITEFGGFRLRISDQNGNMRREIIQIENTYDYTYERNSEDGYVGTLHFGNSTGTFVVGEWIYQYPSGAYGKIVSVSSDYVTLTNIIGTFVSGQIIYQADYGEEILPYGDCSTDWFQSVDSPWAHDPVDGKYDIDGSQVAPATPELRHTAATIGNFYKSSFEVKNYLAGYITNLSPNYVEWVNADGVYTYYVQAIGLDFGLRADSDFAGSIDNCSLKQVTNASLASGTVSYSSSSTSADPEPNLIIQVWARDKYGQESLNPAVLSVSNPAPSAPSGLSTTPFTRAVWFTWQKNTEVDFDHYKYRYKGPTGSIEITDQTGTFTAGNTVYGATSGASATIDIVQSGLLYLTEISGVFQDGEVIYEETYGVELITGDDADFTSSVGNWGSERSGTISQSSGLGILTPTTQTYSGAYLSGLTLTVGVFYTASLYARLQSGTAQELIVQGPIGFDTQEFTPTDTQTQYIFVGQCDQTGLYITNSSDTPNGAIYEIDNISLKVITNAALTDGTVSYDSWSSWQTTQDPEQIIQLSSDEIDIYGSVATVQFEVKAVDTFGNESSASSTSASTLSLEIQASDIDQFAIDATKRSDKIVVLTGDSWTDNSPSAGYIAWNAHTLVYDGAMYSIEAGSTNQAYVYWDGESSSYSVSDTNPGSFLEDGQFTIATNVSGIHDLAWHDLANAVIGSANIENESVLNAHIANLLADKITAGTLTGLNIVGNTIRTSTDEKCVVITDDGIRLQSTTTTGKFNQFVFNDGTKFGSGSLAYIHHKDFTVPFYIAAEQTVADFHYYNRSSTPSGAAEIGDTCVASGIMYVCTGAGTPGTWTKVGTQT